MCFCAFESVKKCVFVLRKWAFWRILTHGVVGDLLVEDVVVGERDVFSWEFGEVVFVITVP